MTSTPPTRWPHPAADPMDKLYKHAILARARDGNGAGTLANADGRATADNPLCGDRVTMEVRAPSGRVEAVAHKVRGCVLCEAAASVIATHAPGATRDEITAVRETLDAMLTDNGPAPNGAWSELSIFAAVAEHRNRHECVRLPFEALRRALDQLDPDRQE